jgi:hypothetical protein
VTWLSELIATGSAGNIVGVGAGGNIFGVGARGTLLRQVMSIEEGKRFANARRF